MTQTANGKVLDLASAVSAELEWTPDINITRIRVSHDGGAVTLFGEVNTYPEMLAAEKAAKRVAGVTSVTCRLNVQNRSGAVDDADLAEEAGEALQRSVDVPDSVTALVEAGVVILVGQVEWRYQRDAAARSVRHLRGVVSIQNRVTISPTASAAGLEAGITTALMRSAQLRGRSITVTTDTRGHVTLSGSVRSWADSKQAEHACWSAPGITEVRNQLGLDY